MCTPQIERMETMFCRVPRFVPFARECRLDFSLSAEMELENGKLKTNAEGTRDEINEIEKEIASLETEVISIRQVGNTTLSARVFILCCKNVLSHNTVATQLL